MNWLYKISFPAMNTSIPTISPQEARNTCWGPWYHGTSSEIVPLILERGFEWEEGESRTGKTQHGYENKEYGSTGCPAPVHHLGYGIYLTGIKNIAKDYGYGSTRNIVEVYVLRNARIETINWGSPNTMMKWWKSVGYDCQLAKKDRVAATQQMTKQLKSQFDAVWYKGKGLRRLLDGNQLCVYNTDILRRVDKKLIQPGEVGSKVIKIQNSPNRKMPNEEIPVGTKGILLDRRPLGEFSDKHGGEKEFLTIKWQKGGIDRGVYGSEVEFL